MARGEYLRAAAVGRLPPVVPELNVQAWAELARVGANLNQVARSLNSGEAVEIEVVQRLLADLRVRLVGAVQ